MIINSIYFSQKLKLWAKLYIDIFIISISGYLYLYIAHVLCNLSCAVTKSLLTSPLHSFLTECTFHRLNNFWKVDRVNALWNSLGFTYPGYMFHPCRTVLIFLSCLRNLAINYRIFNTCHTSFSLRNYNEVIYLHYLTLLNE